MAFWKHRRWLATSSLADTFTSALADSCFLAFVGVAEGALFVGCDAARDVNSEGSFAAIVSLIQGAVVAVVVS